MPGLRHGLILGLAAATTTALANLPTTTPNLVSDPLSAYRDARQSGGPGKDGIPSIDEPQFWSAEKADEFLDDGDVVIGLVHAGEVRAYPQRILVWHEIVNDKVAGDELAITYCPLTGTALGFDRGDTELGVSGKLVNSNLVMYDRATDTEYPQILGAGISGPNEGEGLEEVRVFWTEWGNWRERYPDTDVLSVDTGYARNYNQDPYGAYNPKRGYYGNNSRTLFPVLHDDNRYSDKREVLGFRDQNHAVAVDPNHLASEEVIHHDTGSGEYLIVHDPVLETGHVFRGEDIDAPTADEIRFSDEGPQFPGRSALTAMNAFEAMWFAWYAFYPETEVLG